MAAAPVALDIPLRDDEMVGAAEVLYVEVPAVVIPLPVKQPIETLTAAPARRLSRRFDGRGTGLCRRPIARDGSSSSESRWPPHPLLLPLPGLRHGLRVAIADSYRDSLSDRCRLVHENAANLCRQMLWFGHAYEVGILQRPRSPTALFLLEKTLTLPCERIALSQVCKKGKLPILSRHSQLLVDGPSGAAPDQETHGGLGAGSCCHEFVRPAAWGGAVRFASSTARIYVDR